jgi:hypothetical protein
MTHYGDRDHGRGYQGPGYTQPYYQQPGGYPPGHGNQPPSGPPRRPAGMRRWPLWAALGVVALLFVSCVAAIAGSGDDKPSAGVTPTPVLTSTPAPATSAIIPASTQPVAQQTASTTPELVAIPNVVGSDLQSAQETLFPPLRSTSIDATGQGRMQLWDRDWVVVRQDPAAGTRVEVLTDIKLYVIKPGETA